MKVVRLKRFVFACKPLQDRLRSAAAAATKTRLGARELPSKIETRPKETFARNPPFRRIRAKRAKFTIVHQLPWPFTKCIVPVVRSFIEREIAFPLLRRMHRSNKNLKLSLLFPKILPKIPGTPAKILFDISRRKHLAKHVVYFKKSGRSANLWKSHRGERIYTRIFFTDNAKKRKEKCTVTKNLFEKLRVVFTMFVVGPTCYVKRGRSRDTGNVSARRDGTSSYLENSH